RRLRSVACAGPVMLWRAACPAAHWAADTAPSADWDLAYATAQVLGPPIYSYSATQSLPLSGSATPYTGMLGAGPGGGWNTIAMNTGEYLVITWSFRYVGGAAVRGSLFWITRLGLDFSTIGPYVDTGT